METLYSRYTGMMQQIAHIKYAADILQWDQETYMPRKGGQRRAQQIAALVTEAHRLKTSDTLYRLLIELSESNDLNVQQNKNVALSLEDYERALKLPSDFVYQLAETGQHAFNAWEQAKKENSFTVFEPLLHKLVSLKRQETDYLGYAHHPYNALLNDYDKGCTVEKTDALFNRLKPELDFIFNQILNKKQDTSAFMFAHYPSDAQWNFGIELLKGMGFDFEAGRQDISTHPFTTSFHAKDVRLTTRIDENDFANMVWSCIHEGGHGLYEQGLPDESYGLPLGEYCSLSIHESQSRMWENNIGRSRAYWKHYLPIAKQYFNTRLQDVSEDAFYNAINIVKPSLIRTEADEITYHYHIMIRYEIEKQLIANELSTKDIPAVWNYLYKQYLNIEVPDANSGCLQDVHWSHGSFGYFATYSLGSLYAAQFYEAICRKHPEVEQDIALGNFSKINAWLKQHIYDFGRFYTSEELCKKATGSELNPDHFISYAIKKFLTQQ